MAAVMLLGLGRCAGMSAQGKSTVIGAGVGAVGGAAVGGVIGHEVAKQESMCDASDLPGLTLRPVIARIPQ